MITGIGLVTPLGVGVDANWEALVAGRSGIGPISAFDASDLPARVAGEVRGFAAERFVERKDLKKMDRFIQFAVAAARLAVADAGLRVPLADPARAGVIVGVGMGGMITLEETIAQFQRGEHRRVSPFFIPRLIPNMAAGHVAMYVGARGPSYATTSACASGGHAISSATDLIRDGVQDVVLAGGAEAPICLSGVGGFCAMRALAVNFNDQPARASRPFDAARDGFVIGEGAGLLVLEEYEQARARGARCYAEVLGHAATCDAYHITQPKPDGEGATECLTLALADAALPPAAIGYVNAHGTGTPAGDVAETLALKRVFGDHAHRLAISSTKSMTGHLLGAAGAVEAAYTALALTRATLPPTINLENPDPACDLDYVPALARAAQVDAALSTSFGFGGTNSTLVLGRV